MNVILFGSGTGSLISAICDSVNNGVLNMNIKCLITNNKKSNIGTIGTAFNIDFKLCMYNLRKIHNKVKSFIVSN